MNQYVPEELEAIAEKLTKQAAAIRENDALLSKALREDNVAARAEAERKLAEAEREVKRLEETVSELDRRNRGQMKNIQAIRVALNGAGRNPLEEHAHAVFRALAAAQPDHPLVRRVPGDAPEKAALSSTDLRFVYAILGYAASKMGRAGCNDWSVKNPDRATLYFMQRVENFLAESDKDYERREIKPRADGTTYGPADFTVARYLMHLMEEIYGKEIFDGCDQLGISG